MCPQTAANLMTDDLLMRTAQLTPEYRPLVDFHTEYGSTQARRLPSTLRGGAPAGVTPGSLSRISCTLSTAYVQWLHGSNASIWC